MKKLILIAAMALVSVSLSAQVFIGGMVGVGSTTNTDRFANTNSGSFAVTVAPNVGFKLNDDMCVGGRLGFTTGSTKNGNVVTPDPVTFSIQPYFRYNLLYFGDFAIAGEANTGISISGQTITTPNPGAPDTVTKNSTTSFQIGVVPVLLYQLNKHVTLEADLNFLSVGFRSVTNKGTVDNGAGPQTTADNTQSSFVTIANANSVLVDSTGAFNIATGQIDFTLIQIGFTYAF